MMAKKIEDICFGAVLRRRRTAAGMTQEDLGEHVGVSYQQIQKYETGANRVAFSTIVALGVALQCDPEELVADAVAETKRQAAEAKRAV